MEKKSRAPKKHPMGDAILTALMHARNQGDKKADAYISKYLQDMTELLQNDPEYIRTVLTRTIDRCESTIAQCNQDARKCVTEGPNSPNCICLTGASCHNVTCLQYTWAKKDLAGARAALDKLDDWVKECARI